MSERPKIDPPQTHLMSSREGLTMRLEVDDDGAPEYAWLENNLGEQVYFWARNDIALGVAVKPGKAGGG